MTDHRESLPVAELLEESIAGWRDAGRKLPDLGRRYSAREQEQREQIADECLKRVDIAMRDLRRRKLDSEDAQAGITSAVVELTSCALDLHDPYVNFLLEDGFGQVSTTLARQARRMDASVSMIDILQAARNAWTACGLQALFELSVELTSPVFAYSMLYPYSDNYLDDVRVPLEAKRAFSKQFRKRLSGDRVKPACQREQLIWALIELIEAQYRREDCPQVYESLLAIHHAQEESIRQLRRNTGNRDFDLLRLTFFKGGTSVLADACLAAGHLCREQASFAFRWGVVLQLGDDLQDLRSDRRRGSLTLYIQTAEREPLDEITNRTLQFGRWAMADMNRLQNDRPVLKELLRRSSQLLLIRSAATANELYSAEYLRQLESYSPFRFEFLRQREHEFNGRKREYGTLFEELIKASRNGTDWPQEHSEAAMF